MGHIHKLAETQVALDRCTGEFAIDLKAASVSMEQSYLRVAAERKAAQLTCVYIPACPAAEELLVTGLTIEATIQKAVKVYWEMKQKEWEKELSNHCNLGRSLFTRGYKGSDFPSFADRYKIVDPELGVLGGEEYTILFGSMDDIKFHIDEDKKSSKLSSEAVASRNRPTDWDVRWTQ